MHGMAVVMNHLIHPPMAVISEAQHKAAYYKYMLNEIVYNRLLPIKMCYEQQNEYFAKSFNPENGEKQFKELLSELFEKSNDPAFEEKDSWEALQTYEEFKKQSLVDLADYHCGDCVYVACSCARCNIEDLYELESTSTWSSGHEGNKLYTKWLKDQQPEPRQ